MASTNKERWVIRPREERPRGDMTRYFLIRPMNGTPFSTLEECIVLLNKREKVYAKNPQMIRLPCDLVNLDTGEQIPLEVFGF